MFLELLILIAVVVGAAVLWASPRQRAHQFFFVQSLAIASWATAILLSVAGSAADTVTGAAPYNWLRVNGVLGAIIPALGWLIVHALLEPAASLRRLVSRAAPWLVLGAISASLCLFDTFFFLNPASGRRDQGLPYVAHAIINASSYTALSWYVWRGLSRQPAALRLKLRLLALNFALAFLLMLAISVVGNFTGFYIVKRIGFALIAAAFLSVGWGAAFSHFASSSQAAFATLRCAIVALWIAVAVPIASTWASRHFASSVDLVLGWLACSAIALWLNRTLREWFRRNHARATKRLRQAIIETARTEPHTGKLIEKFEHLLADCSGTDRCHVCVTSGEPHDVKAYAALGAEAHAALCQLGSATPERLDRWQLPPGHEHLSRYLRTHGFGAAFAIPLGSPSPSMIVCLGAKRDGWPLTFPELDRLQNVAELMDNILARSRLTEQAALQSKMAHLAMMSRGLAHDLKNLITPVSSFLIHTDGRYQPGSVEAEVHAAARRSVRIMTDYVREALFFSQRLTPRFERLLPAQIAESVREVLGARARQRGIALSLHLETTTSFSADAVLVQRMLANLIANAIDASQTGQAVSLHIRTTAGDHIQFVVTDSGCGIAPEHVGRIFDAYFTTKEFGDDVRGFGLGLTIAQKIAELHHGTIAASSTLGSGTTMTVELPVRQLPRQLPSATAAANLSPASASAS
ncbi:MAG: HAMP domain-containing sensor histidine kinase [Verrucomicrobiota bacterium]